MLKFFSPGVFMGGISALLTLSGLGEHPTTGEIVALGLRVSGEYAGMTHHSALAGFLSSPETARQLTLAIAALTALIAGAMKGLRHDGLIETQKQEA